MFFNLFGKKSTATKTANKDVQCVDGIDPEMNYCPDCDDEYRGEISICPTCAVSLMTGEEKIRRHALENQSLNTRTMEIEPGDELISIRNGPLKDMKMLQKVLAKEKIPSILAGDEGSCGKGCCGPEMYLQIRKNDTEIASEVLTRDFVKSTALNVEDLKYADVVFDELAAETVCPACGCRFSPTVGACPDCGLCFS
ncbi:MAG: hypothetical protein COA36_12205 [Desulfotalea sp.]|nr:MAG: hypothetical protein COA36_12205 [Desulfotalea sp.]